MDSFIHDVRFGWRVPWRTPEPTDKPATAQRGLRWLCVIARLKPAVDLAHARAKMNVTGVSLATRIAFGLVPAVRVSRLNVIDELKSGPEDSVQLGHNRLRAGMVVAETAIGLVLLIAAVPARN